MNRDRERGLGWEPELEELKERKALAARMGGAEKVARHKGLGKLTVRERIDQLVDPDSFHELGSVAGSGRDKLRQTQTSAQRRP